MITAPQALRLIEITCAFAILLQSLEFWRVSKSFSRTRSWPWALLRRQFNTCPRFLRLGLDFLLSDNNFSKLVFVQGVAALFLLFVSTYFLVGLLFFTVYLIALRFRGSFNGGSDAMTLVLLSALLAAACFKESDRVATLALVYIAVQTSLSYVVAGVSKAKHFKNWLSGKELLNISRLTQYSVPLTFQLYVQKYPRLLGFVAGVMIVWELSFPLAFLNSSFCIGYLCVGFCFHLFNYWAFGLNRFVWVWLASYPAIVFCAQQLGFRINFY